MRILIFYDSSAVILSLVFHSSFMQHYPFGSSCLVGSVKYRFIEFFVFDYGSLPYLLSLFLWLGVTFPVVSLDKMSELAVIEYFEGGVTF